MTQAEIKILVVDDVSELRTFLAGCLKQIGNYEIHQAKNGIDALQKIKKTAIDVVFLDIEMPKQNGLETLKLIHRLQPGIFVIMLSCHSSLKNVKQAIANGANGFIVKPFNNEKVRESLTHFYRLKKIPMPKKILTGR